MTAAARLALLACALLPLLARAQWQWIDAQGRNVYSDLAPPATVPQKNIVRRPDTLQPAAAQPAASAPPALAAPAGPGVLDKALAEQKQRDEQVQARQRAADEARLAATRADNCARARQAKAGLDSGVRMTRTDAQGGRVYLDEAARAAEAGRLQAIIDSDCR